MGENINHDFSDGISKVPANNKAVTTNAIQQKTSEELLSTAESVSQFADATIRILRTKLWMFCTIQENFADDYHGNHMYNLYKNDTPLKGQWPILLTITKEKTYNIRLNPSDPEDCQNFYYLGEWLDAKDLWTEIDTLRSFLSEETVPSSSKIKKIKYFDDEDMDDYLADYEKNK